jgi:lambda family phage portal protein
MLGKLKNWLHQATAPVVRAQEAAKDWTLRRFEAAETNRLNKSQWQKVHDQSINADLLSDLTTIRSRATAEAARNPIVEGVIFTFCTDVVGPNGPTLQVISDDDADEDWCDALEAVSADFWKNPEISGKLDGVELMRLWVRGLWTAGEFLAQKTTASRPGAIGLRLKTIAPRRLHTPALLAGEPDVIMGIRQTREGEPVEYLISDPRRFGAFMVETGAFTPVPAAMVIHRFLVIEEDQARGVPWLTTSLQSTADGRDYDAQVLDAVRQAADQAVLLYTEHPTRRSWKSTNPRRSSAGRMSTLPPGWKPFSFQPTQPTTNYIEYRADRHSEIGRPVNMPQMMVRLDSSGHNYSSARFDGQIYLRGLQYVQGWLARRTLNPLTDDVRREAQLYAAANKRWEHSVLAQKPKGRITYQWTWPVPPHVDPQKEGNGERINMENGTLAFTDACANNGTDEDTQIQKYKRTLKKFQKAGVPVPPVITGQTALSGNAVSQQLALQDAADGADGTASNSTGGKAKAKPAKQPAAATAAAAAD